MKPDLSIIIPCYNCQDTLEEAVESCFKQGISNLEIVLVDDGSKDSTRDIMRRLSDIHPEIKLFYHEKNQGGGATRNTAVLHTTSDIIFCLDSDDILPDKTMSIMLSFLKEKNADGIGIETSIKFIGKDINNVDIIHKFGYVGEKIPLEALLQRNDVYCSLYSTFVFTKKAFEISGGYPTGHGFDTQGFAWRFLAHGLVAYTCPNASYLHRVQFKDSYYIRESQAGNVNYNWRDIFLEHISLFTQDTQKFIRSFDCKDFTKDFFEELKKREHVFCKDVNQIIGVHFQKGEIPKEKRTYIDRKSFHGLKLRIKARSKKFIKKNEYVYSSVVFVYAFLQRINNYLHEGKRRDTYYKQIEKIKKEKKIVVNLAFGGIGDCLVYSTLPRLLKEKYNIDFYLSKGSLDVIRQKDAFTLCFEMNPYFNGVMDTDDVFNIQTFESEKSLYTFLFDKKGKSLVEILERQFLVSERGYPEIYYEPKMIPKYNDVILIDENTISGKKFGWKYKEGRFYEEAMRYKDKNTRVEYVDPKKQTLFEYVDMIYSCKYFVGTFSGGASIAACFPKPFSVLWPYNALNSSNYNFCYKKSKGNYVL